jgi:hypothetical protein
MGENRREEEPPIYLPPWYVKLKNKGKHVLRYGRGAYTWEGVQLGRRNERRFFTGKYRAASFIQATAMVITSLFLILLFALFLSLMLTDPEMRHTSSQRSVFFWVILLTGVIGPFDLFNGVASLVERSWRNDRSEFSYNRGIEVPHALTALVNGQWRTLKSHHIFLQVVIGAAFLVPFTLTIIEALQSGLPEVSVQPPRFFLITDRFGFASLIVLPLFLFGGGVIVNGLLNIWRVARGDDESEREERDRE